MYSLHVTQQYVCFLYNIQIQISRLDQPYIDCHREVVKKDDGQPSEYHYSTRECRKICLQEELITKCQCVTDILLNDTLCSAINKTQRKKNKKHENLLMNSLLSNPKYYLLLWFTDSY